MTRIFDLRGGPFLSSMAIGYYGIMRFTLPKLFLAVTIAALACGGLSCERFLIVLNVVKPGDECQR
jgi:hypothetical protein